MTVNQEKFLQKKEEIIKNLHLKEIKSLKLKNRKESSNFYTTLCKNNKEEKFVLKIIINQEPEWKEKFINEMQICNVLSKIDNTLSPIHIASNDNSSPEWFLYKYQEGKIIGNWFTIDDNFLNIETLNNVIDKIVILQKTTTQIKENLPKTKLNLNISYKNKKKIVRGWSHILDNKIEKRLMDEKLAFYDQNIEQAPLVIAHNDLHPANILVNKKEIYFLDYFYVNFSNPLYDFIFFILCLWPNKKLLKEASKKLKNIFPDLDDKNSPSALSFELSAIEAGLKLYINANCHRDDTQEFLKDNPDLLVQELAKAESAQKYFIDFLKNPAILFKN